MADERELLATTARPLPVAYDRRIAHLLRLAAEQAGGRGRADLARFLLLYDCCELCAKLLQGARDGAGPGAALAAPGGVNLHKLRAATRHFGVATDYPRLRRIFAADEVEARRMSAKMLSAKAMGELSHDYVYEINRRGAKLIDDMRAFLRDARHRGQG